MQRSQIGSVYEFRPDALAVSHGILDAFTSGGLGIALLSPFDTTRYFFPWTPVRVSPIGIKAFFGPWGARVMVSEILWIRLPALAAVLLLKAPGLVRKAAAAGRK